MQRISIEQMPHVKNENLIHLKRYVKFINSRPERDLHQDGFDTHHIYPKSIAKRNEIKDFNDDWNLIELTRREHFIAHMILFYCGYHEMIEAFWRMANGNNNQKFISSRIFEKLKLENIFLLKNKKWLTKNGESIFSYDDDVIYYIENGWEFGRDLSYTDMSKHSQPGSKNGMFGNTQTDDGKRRISDAMSDRVSNSVWMNNGIINKYPYTKEMIEQLLNQGFTFGRINKKANTTGGRKTMNNGVKNILVFINEINLYENKGYVLGSKTKGKSKGSCNDRHCINNGDLNKFVRDDQLNYYINSGWKRGSKTKLKEN